MSPNSLKNFQRKSVAFQDGPPSLIDNTNNEINNQEEHEQPAIHRKLSLGRFNSRTEFNIEVKARRKSLTNYISEKAALITNASRLFNSKSTNNLTRDNNNNNTEITKKVTIITSMENNDYNRLNRSSEGKKHTFLEPEPDYWDTPPTSTHEIQSLNINESPSSSSPDIELNKKKNLNPKAVSLAQIIVQSISASNSNKSSMSSSSSSKMKQPKNDKQQWSNTNKRDDNGFSVIIEKQLIMPIRSDGVGFYNSEQTSPVIPLADYENQNISSTSMNRRGEGASGLMVLSQHHMSDDSNYSSSNVYNSFDDYEKQEENRSPASDKKMKKKKIDLIQSFQTGIICC